MDQSSVPQTNPVPPQPTQNNAPVTQNETDILGIISIVCAFIGLQLPGLIVGLIGVSKAKEKGHSPKLSKIGWILNLVFMIITALIIIAVIIIGAAGSKSIKDAVDTSNKQIGNSFEASTTDKKDFAKGETAKFGGFEVKVNNVIRNYVPADEFDKAASGKELIVVDLTVKNIGNSSDLITDYDFLVDEAGVQRTSSFVDPAGKKFDSAQLANGASMSGQIVYEITAGAKDLKLVKDDYAYNSKTYTTEKVTYSIAI